MYALMGMKLEEWVDGRVNIGIAVCPTKPTAITAIAPLEDGGKRNDMQTSNSSKDVVVVPKSAFIIRPPEHYQSQGRVSVAYAHQPRRPPSKFVITFNPEDQGHQDKISPQQRNFLHYQGSYITENMEQIEDEEVVGTGNQKGGSEEIGLVDSEENAKKVKEENRKICSESMGKLEATNLSTRRESRSLTSPQNTQVRAIPSLQATGGGEDATGSRKEEASLAQTKRSSDMKRVSWVEDAEMDKEKRGSGNSLRENKKESTMRKSNGVGINYNNRSSPSKKQHEFSSAENSNSSVIEGCSTKGNKRRSSDKSRIPAIAGDYPPSCEFYRRQMLRDCMNSPPQDNWYGYGGGTSIHKYAGQKVVEKIAAEQKRLEEDISNRRKTEIWILGNETDDLIMPPSSLALRKRTMRLKPMQFVQ